MSDYSPPLAHALQELTGIFDELLASLSTLKSLSTLEVETLEEQDLIRQALCSLVANYGVERCSVFLLEQGQLVNALDYDWYDCHGMSSAGLKHNQQAYRLEETFMGIAIREKQLQHAPDCQQDPRVKPLNNAPQKLPQGSLLTCPIFSGEEVMGVINLSHPEPYYFSEWQERLVPLFSTFLGQLLSAARLLRSLDKEVAKRTEKLQEVLQETQELKRHYHRLSLVDELTNCYNRRYFFIEGRVLLLRMLRHGHSCSVLVGDMDKFKQINDRYGHAMGDTVLRDVAQSWQNTLRQSDILARIGGEEFALLLPETDQNQTQQVAQRLLSLVRQLHWRDTVSGGLLRTSMSLGLITLPQHTPNRDNSARATALFDRLVSTADQAMYEAKEQGGDRCLQQQHSLEALLSS